jgi:hypothetical protein
VPRGARVTRCGGVYFDDQSNLPLQWARPSVMNAPLAQASDYTSDTMDAAKLACVVVCVGRERGHVFVCAWIFVLHVWV